MAINLTKGQKINLEKNNGSKLVEFCVGCNWGAIVSKGFLGLTKKVTDVDLDLSCVMLDAEGRIVDHIYSPEYRVDLLQKCGLPAGKLVSNDGAIRHSGDDRAGDRDGDDGLDNEVMTVNLRQVSPNVDKIYFFLNNVGQEDFSQIPYAAIRMYEGTPTRVGEVFARYDVSAMPEYAGRRALIMGKLYRRNGEWRFAAIGDAYDDQFLAFTIQRIARDYK